VSSSDWTFFLLKNMSSNSPLFENQTVHPDPTSLAILAATISSLLFLCFICPLLLGNFVAENPCLILINGRLTWPKRGWLLILGKELTK
jgi:hypothetical protein